MDQYEDVDHDFKIITSIVIKDERGRYLLGKRSMAEDVFPGLWSIPGGKVERGARTLDVLEKNVEKEVMEEFGIKVSVDKYVQSHSDGKEKIYIIFLGRVLEGTARPLEDTDEVRWFRIDDIRPEALCPEVYEILLKVDEDASE